MEPVICVVPARMASSRFPGKPLEVIEGIPMVVRSARRALDAQCFSRVVVATEDECIRDVCVQWGIECVVTPVFATGTDRVAYVAQLLQAPWVVNLQGDEPVFPLDLLQQLAKVLPTAPEALWTAADLHCTDADIADEDVVKVVLEDSTASAVPCLDFHRTPTDSTESLAVHIGVYAGSTAVFSKFSQWAQTPREQERRIEPLRALDQNLAVFALVGHWPRAAVDRKEHISQVLQILSNHEEN